MAQDLPDFKSVPKECESKCKDAGIESACGSIDNSDGCLKTVCKVSHRCRHRACRYQLTPQDTAKVKPCLDCAKMGDLYNTLVSLCKDQSGDETGDSSGESASSPLLPGDRTRTPRSRSRRPPASTAAAGGDAVPCESVSAVFSTAKAFPSQGTPAGGDADSAGSASSAATAGASDSASKDGKSGATGLAASGAGIAAAAMLAVYF